MARLGTLERAVMNVLWQSVEGATAQQIRAAIEPTDLKVSTILTVLQRLTNKDMVHRVQQGRAHRYFAMRSSAELVGQLMAQMLADAESRLSVLSFFLNSMSDSELEGAREVVLRAVAIRHEPNYHC